MPRNYTNGKSDKALIGHGIYWVLNHIKLMRIL